MKVRILAIVGFAGMLLISPLHSQDQSVKVTPLQMLTAIKASNIILLEKQQETLKKLEEMEDTARQIKIMAKRS